MANKNNIRFTLSNGTITVVKKVTNNKYDFELVLPNGNRTTFIWSEDSSNDFSDKRGNKDALITEAIDRFVNMVGT